MSKNEAVELRYNLQEVMRGVLPIKAILILMILYNIMMQSSRVSMKLCILIFLFHSFNIHNCDYFGIFNATFSRKVNEN